MLVSGWLIGTMGCRMGSGEGKLVGQAILVLDVSRSFILLCESFIAE